jgi:hypothetical protein
LPIKVYLPKNELAVSFVCLIIKKKTDKSEVKVSVCNWVVGLYPRFRILIILEFGSNYCQE